MTKRMPEGNDYDQINKSITKKDLNYLLGLVFGQNKKENSIGSSRESSAWLDGKERKSPAIEEKGTKNLGRISKAIEANPRALNTKSNLKLVGAIREKLRESAKDSGHFADQRKASSRLSLLSRFRAQRRALDAPIEQINADAGFFSQHLLDLVNNSVGLKQSSPPFSCHVDLLKEYLAKAHRITNFDDTCELTPIVLKFIVLDASLLSVKSDTYDPYFRVYLPGKLNGKQAHKSRHFKNELNPKWNESFQVPVTRYVHMVQCETTGTGEQPR